MCERGPIRAAQGLWAIGSLVLIGGCGVHPFLADRLAIEALVFEGASEVGAVGAGVSGAGRDPEALPLPPRRIQTVVVVSEDAMP